MRPLPSPTPANPVRRTPAQRELDWLAPWLGLVVVILAVGGVVL